MKVLLEAPGPIITVNWLGDALAGVTYIAESDVAEMPYDGPQPRGAIIDGTRLLEVET